MPDFAYIARDTQGQKVTGRLSAGSEREAVTQLSGQSLFPIEVTAEKPKSSQGFYFGKVRGQTMATFYGQLSSLLRSGVALLRSISILQSQSSNVLLNDILSDVHQEVEDGASLGDAMAKHPRAFSEMAVNMVRAGGEGGFLEDALERVSILVEQQEDLKGRTIGALAYPVVVSCAGFIIVAILIVFFVPMYAELFDQLRDRGELPIMTDILLGLSDFLRSWLGIICIAAIFLTMGFIYYRLNSNDEGRRVRDWLKIKLPLVGGIFQSLAVARFCRILGTLLRNGVPILRSLDISRRAAGNRILSDAIDDASDNVTAGASLAAPLSQSGHFPKTVVEMISVAEESNTLDNVLVDIAERLEVRTFRRLELMVRLIEPFMLLILAGVVLCVVIALLLPVITMSSMI